MRARHELVEALPTEKISTDTGGDVLTEPTKPGFVSFGSAGTHDPVGKKSGDAPCPTCNGGSLWRDQTGDWHCEHCTPPGAEPVRTWRNFSGGKAPPAPSRPTEPWPADLGALLRRVATAFEWTRQDVADFVAWARRSPEGLADARAFLEAECAKLPAPGLSDRRRVVLDMLAADPALRVAWTCADDGGDPVVLTLAVRGVGTCELAIPRERFDALVLTLPGLIDGLAR